MRLIKRGLALAFALCGLALVLAACGSSSSKSSSSGASAGNASTIKAAQDGSGQSWSGGKKGGVLTVYDHEDFQHLDPGESYFSLDYEVIYPTQMTLYMFPPNSSTQEVPRLAAGPATVSDGGKTVSVTIKSGVHFSPPVNRAVTCADVKYAIERGANPNVANPYFPSYFDYIVGASKATGGNISGIVCNGNTITFHLTGPYGTFFTGALTEPLTAPVPKEFAAPLDAKKPTAYGSTYLVATGPYMLKSDSHGKFIGIGYQPGKSAILVRNPNWKASTDIVPAYLDQINISIGGDPNVYGRQILTASTPAANGDQTSASIVKLAYQNYYNQLYAIPGSGEYYVALNHHKGAFANVDMRKALWAALDRVAMNKVAGGSVIAATATHFIYPGSAGYQQAGGDAGPNVDYNNSPTGNMTVAKKYIKASGLNPANYTVKVVGSTGDPADKQAAIVNSTLQSLGFKTSFTVVDQPVMYGKYCGTPKQEIDVCPNVGWIRDWYDPQTLLDPTFAGYNMVPVNNSNWSQVSWQDWPKTNGGTYASGPLTPIDQAMKSAETTVGTTARGDAWAKVDRMLVADAAAVPWQFSKYPQIKSKSFAGINDLWNLGSWDYQYSWVK